MIALPFSIGHLTGPMLLFPNKNMDSTGPQVIQI